VGVLLEAGDDDRAGAGHLGSDYGHETALAGAENEHGVAELRFAEVQRPADAGA